MAKQTSVLQLAGISLDFESGIPLYKQLSDSIRKAILEGRLRPEKRLPASRALAKEWGISRNTVTIAFDQLLAEGYLNAISGSGTFVSRVLPESLLHTLSHEIKTEPTNTGHPTRKINSIKNILVSPNNLRNEIRPFRHGIPAIDQFPFKTWIKVFNEVIGKLPAKFFSYGDPAGYLPLREEVANYLRTARAVKCETEQVIIVSGSQQALDLTARILLKPGDKVLIEDPGYLGARAAFISQGITLVPVNIDSEGLSIDEFKTGNQQAKLVYVTPSHQYPLGSVMSISRRLLLLQWAKKNAVFILEDDYDSEFRYTGRPLPCLQGLDQNSQVIYTGSFSKVLFPGLRLGYLVVPPDLVEPFTAYCAVTDRGCPVTEQAVLASFIEKGHFYRHIRRMRNLYCERQQVLIDEMKKELNTLIKIKPSDAGMHLIGWLPENFKDQEVSDKMAQNGIITPAVSNYAIKSKLNPGLILGYTAYNEREISSAVKKMAEVMELYKFGEE
jgi:GntR family transcriptional regulator/MocR family aminotransferase